MGSCSTRTPVKSCVWKYFKYLETHKKTVYILNKDGTEHCHSLSGEFTTCKIHNHKPKYAMMSKTLTYL